MQARRWRSSTRRPRRALKKGSCLDPSGYDAGKKIKGRKRHTLVDTLGLLLNVVVHPADIQDRDGAFHLLRRARRLFPFIERIFADGAYAGRKMAMTVWRTGAWRLQIVKRSDAAGFEVLPKRWIVERTFAWISRNRRLARDFERYATTVAAFIRLAMIRSCSGDLPQMPRHESKLPGWALKTARVPCEGCLLGANNDVGLSPPRQFAVRRVSKEAATPPTSTNRCRPEALRTAAEIRKLPWGASSNWRRHGSSQAVRSPSGPRHPGAVSDEPVRRWCAVVHACP